MKIYIFITFSIVSVGGSQIYVRNKLRYLRDGGWIVKVFSCAKGEIYIHDLNTEKKNIIPDLRYYPQVLSLRRQNSILSCLSEDCDNSDEIIVESHSISFGIWGEKLASKLGAKHLLFSMEEENAVLNQSIYDFLKFKLDNKSLVGITSKNIIAMFPEESNLMEQDLHLGASCSNTIEDYNSSWIDKVKNIEVDYKVCIIGRLDKNFIYSSSKDLSIFIENHKEKKFLVFYIGGGNEIKIRNLFKTLQNCQVIFSGPMYPMPRRLLKLFDVFIGSSGSANAPSQVGKLCISYDAKDLSPIGIYSVTTNNTLFRDKEPILPLSYYLDSILFEHKYKDSKTENIKRCGNFDNHIERVELIETNKYYDTKKIYFSKKFILRNKLKRMSYFMVGDNIYSKFSALCYKKNV